MVFNKVLLLGEVVSFVNYDENNGRQYADFLLKCKHNECTVIVKVLALDSKAVFCKDNIVQNMVVFVEGSLRYDMNKGKHFVTVTNLEIVNKEELKCSA